MLQLALVGVAAGLMREGVEKGIETNVIINNRAGGNAPMIEQKPVERFMGYPAQQAL